MRYSTIVGIDAHSKKNAVCAIVPETGETREAVLSEDPKQHLSWISEQGFYGPVGCVYEAGPTGFGLSRLRDEVAADLRGAIAKQGNSHLRRILVEAASCYSKQFKTVKSEDSAVPEAVREKAEKCAARLRKRGPH